MDARDEVYLSSVVVSELRYGVQRSRWRKANSRLLKEFKRVPGLRIEDRAEDAKGKTRML